MARYDLRDEGWRAVEPVPPKPGRGKRRVDNRGVTSGNFRVPPVGRPGATLSRYAVQDRLPPERLGGGSGGALRGA